VLKKNHSLYSLLLLFNLFYISIAYTQQVKVNIKDEPLSNVLYSLGENYDIQFSFNERLLSKCSISDSNSYSSPKKAIISLVKKCNLTFENNGSVFVVYETVPEITLHKQTVLSGKVIDNDTKEPLPYANILFNKKGLTTDFNGNFSVVLSDSTNTVKVSYLGYYVFDTIISIPKKLIISLNPQMIGLDEVVIESKVQKITSVVGNEPGLIKINPKIATFLPGNRSNTVYNLLRLQPGILAAAEQSKDFMTWGSYQGQTQIVFDGITLFNLGSYNDNIGAINPFMVKDIEVYKGAYNVNVGDRVGGFVNVTGLTGNFKNFGGEISVDNQLVNGAVNIPIGKKNALQIMFRKSYEDKLKSIINPKNKNVEQNTYTVDQKFTDINIKFSGYTNSRDNYFVSLIGNRDFTENLLFDTKNEFSSSLTDSEHNQFGGSIFYEKNWSRLGKTNFTFSSSIMDVSKKGSTQNFDSLKTQISPSINSNILNGVSETSIKIDHFFPKIYKQSISTGFGVINNQTTFESSSYLEINNSKSKATRLSGYIKDNITLFNSFYIEPGLRIDIPLNIKKSFIQPRVKLGVSLTENSKLYASTGLYKQFLIEYPIFDSIGNSYYNWAIVDTEENVVQGNHNVLGASYSKNDFTINVEGFYKTSNNLSRLVESKNSVIYFVTGKSRILGIDFYIKKSIRKHQFWISYTISKTEELFSNFSSEEYQLAPQDQRHELKGATIFNFNPIYVSLNYVYGSGLSNSEEGSVGVKRLSYKRFDAAILYRFNTQKINLETGVSVLNVLNQFNVRYNNFTSFSNGTTIYERGIPITPSILFKLSF
jgi:carboxypeptidase-like protein/TonB-dependent receptor-like protein